jgi:single-strand DNA-binding protein
VVILGQLRMRSWETPDGEQRSVVEVTAEEVAPSLRWATAKPERTSRTSGTGKRGSQVNDQPDF